MHPKSLVQSVRAAHAPATDRSLLAEVVAGRGEGAFDQIVRRHGPMVFRVCRRVLGHRQDAEDAFQATFVVLFRRAGHVTKPDSLGSWLHGVAVRVSREILAMRTRRLRSRWRPAAQLLLPLAAGWLAVRFAGHHRPPAVA